MLYFEDFEVGSRRELGSYLVTEEELLASRASTTRSRSISTRMPQPRASTAG